MITFARAAASALAFSRASECAWIAARRSASWYLAAWLTSANCFRQLIQTLVQVVVEELKYTCYVTHFVTHFDFSRFLFLLPSCNLQVHCTLIDQRKAGTRNTEDHDSMNTTKVPSVDKTAYDEMLLSLPVLARLTPQQVRKAEGKAQHPKSEHPFGSHPFGSSIHLFIYSSTHP